MLWLLPVFLKTALYLFGCPVGGILSLFSNVIYTVFLVCVIPIYFLYAGPEAAVRFSLLLCVHSLLLAMVPRIVVSLKCGFFFIKLYSVLQFNVNEYNLLYCI